jgi:uncharacterized protein (TIGR03435 family)
MRYLDWDVDMIAGVLALQLAGPVHSDTGLIGKFDFELLSGTRRQDVDDGGPDLATAVQGQLGLKLERKKGPVDVAVIDDVERTPTAN